MTDRHRADPVAAAWTKMIKIDKTILLAASAFALALLVLPFYDNGMREVNANERVRAYLTMALVEDGTGMLDRQVEAYGLPLDRAEKDGRVYCDKAPGVSFLAVPVYATIYLTGARSPFYLLVYFFRIAAVGVPVALMLICMVGLLRQCVREEIALAATATYFLGTIALPLSSVFFGHQAAAAFCFMAYYFLRMGSDHRSVSASALAGLLAATGVVIEFPTAMIAVGLFCLVLADRGLRRAAPAFIAGFVAPLALLLWYNGCTFGNALDFGYAHTEHYFRLLGLNATGPLAALEMPSWRTLWELACSSYRGLFFFSPVLLAAIWGLYELYARGKRAESVVIASLLVAYFTFNASMRDWAGGWSPGPRHLAPVIPFMALPLALTAQRIVDMRAGAWKAVSGACICGAAYVSVLVQLAVMTTYLYFPWDVYHPLRDVCLVFLSGGAFACTLPSLFGAPDYIGIAVFIGGAAVFLWAFCRGAFKLLAPSKAVRLGAVLFLAIWLCAISALPTSRTLSGDKFLALIYWNSGRYGHFLDASRRIIEASGSRDEKLRYAKQSIYAAYEIMKEPERALWFYEAYESLGGARGES
ncbi:MAG: hypothetical protein P8123_02730 [bacterium]